MTNAESQTPNEVIHIKDLTYQYADGTPALNRVSFVVNQGETVAIVGPNGAGKTTLILHLNGILPQPRAGWWTHLIHGHGHSHEPATRPKSEPPEDSGVWIDGMKISSKTLNEVRKRVGLLFQDPDDQLFAISVIDDVAFGPLNHGMERAQAYEWSRQCLAEVGLDHVADRPPNHLSFGERKRVCLAGVLACRPSIIVMDEPTANLDPRSRRRFIELTKSLQITKLLVTHDLEMVLEICDRVILMDQGEIITQGKPFELLADKELIEKHGLEVPPSLAMQRRPL